MKGFKIGTPLPAPSGGYGHAGDDLCINFAGNTASFLYLANSATSPANNKKFWDSASGTYYPATGIILGTPEFMSPEQLRGKPLDPREIVLKVGEVMNATATPRTSPPVRRSSTEPPRRRYFSRKLAASSCATLGTTSRRARRSAGMR